jgi:signal transduction histidine kinase/DNA-binding NarL/FixJ family response regulator
MVHALVIADQGADRAYIQRALAQGLPGLVVSAPSSPAELRQHLEAGNVDVAITAARLAWGDSLQALAQIRASLPACPVIMWGARADSEIALAALHAGLDAFVPREPGDERRLLAAARAALGDRAPELAELERAARHRAEEAERRLASMVEASAALADSLDYATTLQRVADLMVPALGDWCGVDLLDDDGQLRRLAVAHTDPERIPLAYELHRRFPPAREAPGGIWEAMLTGQPQLHPELSDETLAAIAQGPEHLELLHALVMRSVMFVPLSARGRALGTLTLVSSNPGRRYTTIDLQWAMILARRASLSIDNARLYAEAQAAIAARDHFLSIATHELKTPLTSLLGYVGILRRRFDASETATARDRRALQMIESQGNRLHGLILSLLDLSRLQTGQLSIDPAPLDLCSLARRAVEELEPILDQHTVSLALPPGPLMISGDEQRLEQVIQNLLYNAIKYSPGGGLVTVRLYEREGMVRLVVEDQGIGVPSAALPQLFGRFYRAPNASGRQIGGMGLGLYVVREIMELHGGSVEVESEEGAGSSFILVFPGREGEA